MKLYHSLGILGLIVLTLGPLPTSGTTAVVARFCLGCLQFSFGPVVFQTPWLICYGAELIAMGRNNDLLGVLVAWSCDSHALQN